VSGELHAPAVLPQRKELRYPLDRVCFRVSLDAVAKREKIPFPAPVENLNHGPARSLVTAVAHIWHRSSERHFSCHSPVSRHHALLCVLWYRVKTS